MTRTKYSVRINIEFCDTIIKAGDNYWHTVLRVIYASNEDELIEKLTRFVEKQYPNCIDYFFEYGELEDEYDEV